MKKRLITFVFCLLFAMTELVIGDPLVVTCPAVLTIPCNQLENLEVTGQAAVSGGCNPARLRYRDSVLAVDSLVVRIWNAEDSCGDEAACFQSIVLESSIPRIAVLPLENLSSAEEGARVLQRLFEDALGHSAVTVLISPAKVDEAIARGRVRQPVLMDDEQRQRLSQEIDAQYFLVGSLLNYETYQDQYSGPIPMVSCALQLQRAYSGKSVWSESFHAVGNDGEWLFALGVEHDITRLGRELSRKAADDIAKALLHEPCNSVR